MSTFARPQPAGPAIVAIAAAIGLAVALYYYFMPLTGITGAPGTLLVIVSSLLLLIDGVILWFAPRGFLFGLLWVLGLLGAIGTLVAGWFLHAWWLMLAIAIVVIGLVVSLVLTRKS
ncbi:hypothetical protein IC608_01900 [Devosia sp. PTR5]|uniref:Uncharacterized protein n=1 Tax=Devosia oryzisoli TaxID=2774138 RepID=A0A927FS92_9HYPH|nr:hypothetical protein [Devosia oryzisoli]MBD8064229.1 hypothetical protein [Devosia oryzisoli]